MQIHSDTTHQSTVYSAYFHQRANNSQKQGICHGFKLVSHLYVAILHCDTFSSSTVSWYMVQVHILLKFSIESDKICYITQVGIKHYTKQYFQQSLP